MRETTRTERLPYLALGRYRRYSREAIEAWLAEQQGGPPLSQRSTGSSGANELGMRSVSSSKGKWRRVWRYEGNRGTVWRIRYTDAASTRVLETLGKEPTWSRKRAEAELRRRLVDVEREGYRKPEKLTFAAFAERWLEEYLPGRGLKQTTVEGYEQTLRRHLLPAFGRYELSRLAQKPELIDRHVSEKIRACYAPKTVVNQLLVLQWS